MSKLGYTWYPKDFISDPDVMMMTPTERSIYRDLIDLAYLNGNKITYSIDALVRYTNASAKEIKQVIETKGVQHDGYFSIPSCDKRIEKAERSRTNGKTGGKPKTEPKDNPEHNPEVTQNITQEQRQREREREREIKTESDWEFWGNQIVSGNDFVWTEMKGRKVSQDEMDSFLSVATRNSWKMNTQQEFRTSLKGFKPNGEAKKSKIDYKIL